MERAGVGQEREPVRYESRRLDKGSLSFRPRKDNFNEKEIGDYLRYLKPCSP
jgi:hypothetical protein